MTTKPDLIFGDDGNQIVFKCVPNIDEEKVGFLIKYVPTNIVTLLAAAAVYNASQ